MRRIAIINQKGGVGKTTTSTNLGAALALEGRRVVVVDMDAQAHLSLCLNVDAPSETPSTYTVLTSQSTIAESLRTTTIPNLQILASNIDLSGAEIELASALGREYLLRDAIGEWVDAHTREHGQAPADYLIFDCPPSLGLLSINALTASREVIIALQTEFLALQGMTKLVEIIQVLKKRMNPALEILGILPCLYDSRLKLAREVLGEIRAFFPEQVFANPIRSNVKLAEAPSFGKTIFEYAPESNGAQDYLLLAQALIATESRHAELAGLPAFRFDVAAPRTDAVQNPPAEPASSVVPEPPLRARDEIVTAAKRATRSVAMSKPAAEPAQEVRADARSASEVDAASETAANEAVPPPDDEDPRARETRSDARAMRVSGDADDAMIHVDTPNVVEAPVEARESSILIPRAPATHASRSTDGLDSTALAETVVPSSSPHPVEAQVEASESSVLIPHAPPTRASRWTGEIEPSALDDTDAPSSRPIHAQSSDKIGALDIVYPRPLVHDSSSVHTQDSNSVRVHDSSTAHTQDSSSALLHDASSDGLLRATPTPLALPESSFGSRSDADSDERHAERGAVYTENGTAHDGFAAVAMLERTTALLIEHEIDAAELSDRTVEPTQRATPEESAADALACDLPELPDDAVEIPSDAFLP